METIARLILVVILALPAAILAGVGLMIGAKLAWLALKAVGL